MTYQLLAGHLTTMNMTTSLTYNMLPLGQSLMNDIAVNP